MCTHVSGRDPHHPTRNPLPQLLLLKRSFPHKMSYTTFSLSSNPSCSLHPTATQITEAIPSSHPILSFHPLVVHSGEGLDLNKPVRQENQ